MKLSIEALREKEVKDIHIHCFKSNIASAKIISQNGGILDSEIIDNHEVIQRFIVGN